MDLVHLIYQIGDLAGNLSAYLPNLGGYVDYYPDNIPFQLARQISAVLLQTLLCFLSRYCPEVLIHRYGFERPKKLLDQV
jgi:hypothetical protein